MSEWRSRQFVYCDARKRALSKWFRSKVKAITAKSVDDAFDESHFAEMVVKKSDLDWQITNPTTEDFLSVVDEVIEIQEEPFGSPSIIMQYFVMKKAKEAECIVLLDGQGGDETALGYDRYYVAYLKAQKGIAAKIRALRSIYANSGFPFKTFVSYFLYFTYSAITKVFTA